MTVVDGIEANDGGEQTPIRLRQVFAGQVAMLVEPLFEPIELGEQFIECCFVGLLR